MASAAAAPPLPGAVGGLGGAGGVGGVGGVGAPAAAPAVPVDSGRLAFRVLAFVGLATLVAQRYAALDFHPPAGRVVAVTVLAAAAGAALAGTESDAPASTRWPRRVARALIVLVGLWATLLAVGVPGHLLWPAHWGTLASHVRSGLDGLGGWLWPYRGDDRWARLDVLMVLPFALVAAAALYMWPSHRGRAGRGGLGLGVLVSLYVAGVVNGSHAGWQVEGVLLFAGVAAWLYLPGLGFIAAQTAPAGGQSAGAGGQSAVAGGQAAGAGGQAAGAGGGNRLAGIPGVAAWLAGAAALAAAGAALLAGGQPWLNYRAWNPTGTETTSFQWDQTYGPITWSRSTAPMFEVAAQGPEMSKVTSLDRFDGVRFLRSASPVGGQDFGRAPVDGQWFGQATFTISGLRSRLIASPGSPLEVGWLSTNTQDVTVEPDETAAVSSTLAANDSYYVTYYAPHPPPGLLRAAPRAFPARYLSYTGFELPGPSASGTALVRAPAPGRAPDPTSVRRILASPYARVYQLARVLARGRRTPYDTAASLQRFLLSHYAYDEHPAQSAYPLATFLFDDRRGYCQQFSGAMALMLRMDGIPARVAAGFLPGQLDPKTGRYRVRAVDAHSWVEVYFTGIGWVPFNPTPPRTANGRATFAAPPFADSLVGSSPSGRPVAPHRRPEPGGGPLNAPRGTSAWPVLAGVGGALVLALAVWLAVATTRVRRALAGDASGAVAELRRALLALGYPLAPRMTLAQLERRMQVTRGPEVARYAAMLRARRFAGATATQGPTRRDRRALRRALSEGRGPVARVVALLVIPPAA